MEQDTALSPRPDAESARIFEAIFEAAVDAIILIDRRGHIEAFNPAAERLFGYTVDEVLGHNVSMLMPEPYASEHDGYIHRYQGTGVRHIIGIGREVTARRRDGTTFPIHLSVAEMTVGTATKYAGILRDLTERVKLEDRLRDESGLVRIGELAAVLAHEVRNPLAAVSGAIQVLSQRLTAPDEREVVDEVLKRLDSLGAMMNDLLLYARPPKPKFTLVEVSGLLDSLITFMRHDRGWEHIIVDVDGDAPDVLADGELLKVALQNLLVNAVQAMDGKGTLLVRFTHAGAALHIDVIDQGPGIPLDVQPRLFTPFFTTKARGTGLGLATVRRIAEAHGGTARILTSGADGTSVRFTMLVRPGVAVTLD